VRAIVLSALALALGLAVSACSPSVGVGDACSRTDPCDEGVCNLSGPGDPVCVDANGDLDNDGILNKDDFCNQQPGGRFDEDGDLLGDECDPCPIAPPPAQADTDTDGIDAPCDPDPTINGNQLVLFEGFNGALPANAVKTGTGGTWEAKGGEVIFTSTDATADATLTVPLKITSRHLAVQASYRIDQVDPAAGQNLAGVLSVQRLPLGVKTIGCAGSRSGGMDSLIVTSDAGSATKAFSALFAPTGLYRIAQLIENATGACAMSANTEEGGVSMTTAGETLTEAGLLARGVNARFQYLLIVQRPN
jgi:hypothetical protein